MSMISGIVLLLIMKDRSDADVFSDIYWTSAIRLSEYSGYGSVSLLSYNIPPQTSQVTFTFQAKSSGISCFFKEVYVYFQHGSYPLVTPYNETFPEKFFTNRTSDFHIKIQKDAQAVSYMLDAPEPGNWYFAAFLPKHDNGKIEQKGIGKSCLYGMVIVVEATGLDNVQVLPLETTHRLTLTNDLLKKRVLYRYALPTSTVEYKVKINNCSTKMLSEKSVLKPTSPTVNSTASAIDQSSEPSKLAQTSPPVPKANTSEHLVANDFENSSNYSYSSTVQSNETDSDNARYNPDNETKSLQSSSFTQKSSMIKNLATSTTDMCPVIAVMRSSALPNVQSATLSDCGNQTECEKRLLSPSVDGWTYITIAIDDSYNVSEISFDLSFETKECESLKIFIPRTIFHPADTNRTSLRPAQDKCIRMTSLGRFVWEERTFNITYVLNDNTGFPNPLPLRNLVIEDHVVMLTSFTVQSPADLGGTLLLHASLNLQAFTIKNQTVTVYMCVMRNALPGGETVRSCETGIAMVLNFTAPEDTVYIPYPEPGTWFISFNSECYSNDTKLPTTCSMLPMVDVDLVISGCVEGQCGDYGVCQDYISGVHVFSSCKCYAGWRGYGCTDGTEGRTKGEELVAMLLLTLSNLFFLPSIVLALYRRYFVEALVYTFTMFFSTFYHACDTSDIVYYCMVKYDILSFADFLGSISSFWVTMLVMSKIPPRVRSFAQTLGVLLVAVGTEYDRHGLLVFAVPSGLAAVVMFGSWIFQCRRQRKLYPTRRYYLIHLLPGVILALTGLVLFAFLETQNNYKYVHSCWHMCMSLSIVFLLPQRPTDKGNGSVFENDTDSDELILVTDENPRESINGS
ncbi:post-GPI attachment to proteins factor 6-like isoform X3 [Dreissena polymorpha]|uniref:post-GPI attachment to proteins factor 6-like isoform X3 n=1 Tax=Dreissena polymorpha TaxID=45954 RepID=UPI00226483FB|nr:post-GPI attachment to proteins factor 6-like isoform X3 [Dreissena polymorpha]